MSTSEIEKIRIIWRDETYCDEVDKHPLLLINSGLYSLMDTLIRISQTLGIENQEFDRLADLVEKKVIENRRLLTILNTCPILELAKSFDQLTEEGKKLQDQLTRLSKENEKLTEERLTFKSEVIAKLKESISQM